MNEKRVLVADDEKDACDFLKNYLAARNFIVDVAYDGLKAKEMLGANAYDYIFMDCNMPGLTGLELVKVIGEKNRSAIKVMISGYDLINEVFVKDMGIDVYLTKPVSLEKIKEICDGKK